MSRDNGQPPGAHDGREFCRAADPATAHGREIDETGFAKLLTRPGDPPKRVTYPVDKVRPHPLNRDLVPADVQHKRRQLEAEGQRDALFCRLCPAWWSHRTDEFAIPEGHVQVLDGAHRLAAAKLLDWSTIDVVICSPVDDAQAEQRLAGAAGTLQWPVAEKGRLAAAMQARGLTLSQIAEAMGVGDKGVVSHWIALNRLPDYWRAVVDGIEVPPAGGKRSKKKVEGRILKLPASWLRPLEPYVEQPTLMRFVYDAMIADLGDDDWNWDEWTRDRDGFAQCVRSAIADTGPIDSEDRPRTTYVQGDYKHFGRLFELTPELEKQLAIVEVAVYVKNKKQVQRRATNLDLYEKLQAPLVKRLEAGEIDVAGRPLKTKGKGPSPKGKAAAGRGKATGADPPEETAAQKKARQKEEAAAARERRKEQDRQLKDTLARWRIRLLRQQLAAKLQPADWLVPACLPFLLHCVRNDFRNHWVDKIVNYVANGKQQQLDHRQFWRACQAAIDPEDPDRDVDRWACRVCQLLLWPFDPGAPATSHGMVYSRPPGLSDVMPEYDDQVIEDLGKLALIDVREAWRAAASPKSQEWHLVREYFELHKRDQLVDLAEKLKRDEVKKNGLVLAQAGSLKKTELVDWLIKSHEQNPTTVPF